MFQEIKYKELNSRQKKNYNFQKITGRLADYGYFCIRSSDDWQGADFLAIHVDGETVLRARPKSC